MILAIIIAYSVLKFLIVNIISFIYYVRAKGDEEKEFLSINKATYMWIDSTDGIYILPTVKVDIYSIKDSKHLYFSFKWITFIYDIDYCIKQINEE
jgi:hypothetical protein